MKAAQDLVQGTTGLQKKNQQAAAATAAMPTSDAVLNCPACMTTLCIDCQRLVSVSGVSGTGNRGCDVHLYGCPFM